MNIFNWFYKRLISIYEISSNALLFSKNLKTWRKLIEDNLPAFLKKIFNYGNQCPFYYQG